MAKAKKGKLTIEDALVPVEEQPYEIPMNWCWTRFEFVMDNYDSMRIPLSTKERSSLDKIYDYYGASGVIDKVDNYLFDDAKLLIGEDGANLLSRSTPIAFIASGKYWVNNHAHVLDNKAVTTKEYVCYYINSIDLAPYVTGSAQPKLTQDKTNNILVPLPPLAEQKRIVEQIENMFAKLDEATEKAQGVVEQFELHKESILHQAFSGYLSEKWRIENGISADSWVQTSLGTYLNPMKTRKPEGETFRYIDIDAIDNKKQVIREAKETPVSEAPSRASRAVNSGDVLFSMVRPYLKNIAYVTEDMSDCIVSTGFYVCSCKDGLYSKYLYELLRSKDAIDYLMQFMKGDNSPSIRKDDLLDMPLRLPCIDEQKEICQIVSSLLQKEEEAKEAAVKVIDQIDLMKKSILAKAFRGELGTNIADEESAVELLKQILVENL